VRTFILTSFLLIGVLGCERVYEAVQSGCWGDCLWGVYMKTAQGPPPPVWGPSEKHPLYTSRAECLAVIYALFPEVLRIFEPKPEGHVSLRRIRHGIIVTISDRGESRETEQGTTYTILNERATVTLWCQQVPYEGQPQYSPKGRTVQ
jgi:hypothetical protein